MSTPVWMCGFESNDTGVWDTVIGTVTITTTTIKTGDYGVCHESASSAKIDLDTPVSAIYLSIQVEPEDVYSGGGAGSFFDIEFILDTDEIIKLRLLQSDLYWDAYVDGSKVKDGVIGAVDSWQNIQVFVKVHATDGQIQTRIDRAVDVVYEGDTAITDAITINSIKISTDTDGADKYCYYDDVYICTGGWPGEIYIERVEVNTTAEVE